MMRRFVAVVAVLALLWSGWWVAVSYMAANAVRGWFAERASFGRMAGLDGMDVGGFPQRVALTLEQPYVADPFRGLSWAGSELRLTAPIYPPLRLDADLPQVQTVRLADGTVLQLRAVAAQAGATLTGLDLRLNRVDLDGQDLALDIAGTEVVSIGALRLDVTADPQAPAVYRAVLRVEDMGGPSAAGPLPASADVLAFDGVVALSGPLDRHLGAGRDVPQVQRIDIAALRLVWGRVELSAEGSLRPDSEGRAEGQVALRLRHWRDLLDAAVALDALDPEIADTWGRALALIAAEAPEAAADGVLDTTLSFRNGRMRIGPLPIGLAPLMRPAP